MILVIPDSHVHSEDTPLGRFFTAGEIALEEKAHTIVIIGDFVSFDSISFHAKRGSLEKEGLRLKKDLDSGVEAFKMLMQPIFEYNKKQRKQKGKQYKPTIIYTKGNHENRLDRFIEENPVLEGMFELEQGFNDVYPVQFYEYGKYAEVSGILFTHIPMKGGRPLATRINSTGQALELVDKPIVYGHTHRLEIKQRTRVGSNKLITAVNVGCFFPGIPGYMTNDKASWWKGLVLLEDYASGEFNIRTLNFHEESNG